MLFLYYDFNYIMDYILVYFHPIRSCTPGAIEYAHGVMWSYLIMLLCPFKVCQEPCFDSEVQKTVRGLNDNLKNKGA